MRVTTQIELTNEELAELTALARSKLTSVRLALRAHRAAGSAGIAK